MGGGGWYVGMGYEDMKIIRIHDGGVLAWGIFSIITSSSGVYII